MLLFASLERIGSLSRVVGQGLETLEGSAASVPGRAAAAIRPALIATTKPLGLAPGDDPSRKDDTRDDDSPIADPSIARATGNAPKRNHGSRFESPPISDPSIPALAGPSSPANPSPEDMSVPGPLVPLQPAAAAPPMGPAPGAPTASGTAAPLLRIQGLTVTQAADGEALIRQLDLEIAAGDRLLITGPSGCGKTSLLRVLSELAPAAAGSIERGEGLAMMVLPQAPYMTLGSLREQILFPTVAASQAGALSPGNGDQGAVNGGSDGGSDDTQLREILRQVRLQTLEQRHPDLAEICDWARVLSGGEQQRLGFARLLLHQPDLAVLDEATSALDLASETQLYGDLVARGCTLISVGHRRSLRAFHQRELRLDGQGGWTLEAIT